LALGFALTIGMTGALGTLFPMIVFHADAFRTSSGLTILGGVVLMLIGVCLCALAGKWKESAMSMSTDNEKGNKHSGSFYKGLIICIISGVASPMLNFAFVFGKEIVFKAEAVGALPAHASNPIWCWTMTSAFIITFIYCLFLMNRDRGWDRYVLEGTGRYWGLTFSMGALWSGSIALYGIGLSKLGPLAASIGWPILMITSIVMGNLCGIITGEWKGAGRKSLITMVAGLVVLSIAICLIGMGNA
jgi:L-rhamnose-H+ transport protein